MGTIFTWHVHVIRRYERRRYTWRTNAHRRRCHEAGRYGSGSETHLRRRGERRRRDHRWCYPGVQRYSGVRRILKGMSYRHVKTTNSHRRTETLTIANPTISDDTSIQRRVASRTASGESNRRHGRNGRIHS